MLTEKIILNTIRKNKKALHQLGIKNVGLFGSYSTHTHTPESDIDILVDFDTDKETFENFMAVYDMLEVLFPGRKVELVTKNGLSPYIGPQILKEVIYA